MQLTGPPLVAVATGIVGSAWASGAIAFFTFVGVPAAKDVPETTPRAWQELYHRGANLMPKVAAVVMASYGYAAYDAHRAGAVWSGYVAAASSVIAIVPFTLVVMRYTNSCLHKMADGLEETKSWNLHELLSRWNMLNLTRSALCLVSSVLGMVTMLQNIN